MIDLEFKDSRFIASAWMQLLETQAPQTVIFFTENKNITVKEVIDILEGRNQDLVIKEEILKFFREVVSQAMRIARGRFSSGLVT